jgi:serine/threonine protein kinase
MELPLHIISFQDLNSRCTSRDENGQKATFSFIDQDDNAYYGEIPDLEFAALSLEDVNRYLKHIPDEVIYPKAPPGITVLPESERAGKYIKRPKLSGFNSDLAPKLQQLLLDEAEIFEILLKNPHQNIIRYHGCIIKNGRIAGLALDRYPTNLEARLADQSRPFKKALCRERIKSATDHIHDLQLAHNDLNPSNILVDDEDEVFVTDLGSCRPFGAALITTGTIGWIDEDFTTSERHHDETALEKIEGWLDGTYDPWDAMLSLLASRNAH